MARGGYWRESLAATGFGLGMISGAMASLYLVPVTDVSNWLLASIPWASAGLHFLLGWTIGARLDRIPRPWMWITTLSAMSISLGAIGGIGALGLSLDAFMANAVPSIPLLLVLHVTLTWWIGPLIGGAIDRSRNWRREMSDPRK